MNASDPTVIQTLHAAGRITDLDHQFTRFLARKADESAPDVLLAVCLASHWTGNGNVCVSLPALAGEPLFETGDEPEPLIGPALGDWRKALRRSTLIGRPGEFRPLILDRANRLYLYRYWDYEQRLAEALRSRAAAPPPVLDETRLRVDLEHLFGPPGKTFDWQKIAAATAVLRRLCVISGGPGTGKTTTVLRVLALLLGQSDGRLPIIDLAAPTGKAAARLQETIRQRKALLDLPPEQAAAIPEQARTLHRLLGVLPDGVNFRHHRDNPLPLDVLVVDEASMIDLALMTKLVEALPAHARLILLGDKDQLASVEAGAVLGDICGRVPAFSVPFNRQLAALTGEALPAGRAAASPLTDCVVQLRTSHRFGARSGIGRLARLVNRGETRRARELLERGDHADLRWQPLNGNRLDDTLALRLAEGYGDYLRLLARGAEPAEVIAAFDGFRVLCALRHGPFGVVELNRAIERILRRRGLIRGPREALWYPGRPVLINRNDYALQLYNGDIGLCLPDEAGNPRVWFPTADGGLRALLPARLPSHETVFAMTVHKSQGSEFDRVLIVLPASEHRVLGRELLYTAITRARARVELWATATSFDAAVRHRTQRASGLGEMLWRERRAGRR